MSTVTKRLFPLYAAAALLNVGFWVPVEKLFQTEIGFDAATVGLMAAAYSALIPLVEIPSGILADRWSRRGVLMVSALAMAASVTIGGLSHSVPVYIAGAMAIGVYFAMYAGTVESILYDAVVEETGSGDGYQHYLGRFRMVESAALVVSALAGGWIAGLTSPRFTYFLTLPFALLSIVFVFRLREPTLHKSGERTTLRTHLATTYQAAIRRVDLLPVVALAVLTALVMSVLFEFGPLWLVALSAAAVVYGPFWAALVSTIGLGGLLADRIDLSRPRTLAAAFATMLVATIALTAVRNLWVVAVAQVLLMLLVMASSIHVNQLLHDAVPSQVRTGVAAGVNALSWIVFFPFALVFGAVSKSHGVYAAAWLIVAAVALVGAALVVVAVRRPVAVVADPALEEAADSDDTGQVVELAA